MAYQEVNKIHTVISHLTVNQRNIVEYTLKKKQYTLQKMEHALNSLRYISVSSNNVLDTHTFLGNMLDTNYKRMEYSQRHGGLIELGIYTLLSEIEQYSSLGSQIQDLKMGQYEALTKIDEITDKLFELTASVNRFDEIGMGLGKGLAAFRHCFNDFCKTFFLKARSRRENGRKGHHPAAFIFWIVKNQKLSRFSFQPVMF